MQYGNELWARIWRFQLGLNSPSEFWECLDSRKEVPRDTGGVAAPAVPTRNAKHLLALIHGAGLSKPELDAMSDEEFERRYEQFLQTGQ